MSAARVARSMRVAFGFRVSACLLGAALLAAGPSARAEPKVLPGRDQVKVNRAINRGVKFLKRAQGNEGTWSVGDEGHRTGYAALPGLTLLECGVPANDPSVQAVAAFVRHSAPKLDTTYELALAVLFLD